MIKVILVDDHKLILQGIVSLLESDREIHILSTAKNGLEGWIDVEKFQPDLLITDIEMPRLNGIHLSKQVKKKYPHIKILVLTMHNDVDSMIEIYKSGVDGFVLKTADQQELLFAIRTLAEGKSYFTSEVTRIIFENMSRPKTKADILSERELEILTLISEGMTSQEIAEVLFISKMTVETHRKNILLKCDVKNVAELLKFARLQGWIGK